MIVSIKRYKIALAVCGVFILILSLACAGLLYRNDYQSKADRSNAMQVNTTVAVDKTTPTLSQDFFTEYRIERDRIRSERSELLQTSIKSAKNDEAMQRAQEAVLKIIMEKQHESEIESLIKARGFSDALVFIWDNSVSVVIKAASLSRDEVVQIADIVSRVAGAKPENITISVKP